MSIPGFLFDEHVPSAIVGTLLSLEPAIHIEPVGQAGCPAKGTLDPELIEYAHQSGLVIVTHDMSTMAASMHTIIWQPGNTTRVLLSLPASGQVRGRLRMIC